MNHPRPGTDQAQGWTLPTDERIFDAAVVFDADRAVVRSGTRPESLAAHRARFDGRGERGRREDPTPESAGRLLELLDGAALAGRGGAHFSVAAKWRTALAAGGGGIVVANGAEGEPASAKDAALLLHRPHLVLDGLARAAEATSATRSVVWLHEGAPHARHSLMNAIRERRAARIPEPPVQLATGPDGYLTGESSAVVRALSAGPALPAFARTPAAASGVDGLPTLVHNVETLTRIGLLARTRPGAHRDTTLVTVVTDRRRTVLEVDPTTTVAEAVTRAAGRAEPFQAVLLGGYGGSWLPWAVASDVPLEHRALRAAGAGLGAGVVVPLPARTCGLAETAAVADYLARASARQCGPCLFGLRAIADLLLDLTQGTGGRGHVRRLDEYVGEVAGRGACHHPDGAARFVATALTTFRADVHQHARRGRCLHRGTTAILPIPSRTPRERIAAGRR